MLAAVTYNIGTRAIDAFAPRYLETGRSINEFDIFFLISMLKVAGFFSSPLSGKLFDKVERTKVLYVLIAIEALSLYAITIMSATITIIPCISFGFASFGLLVITDAFLADISPRDYASTIFGVQFTTSFAVGATIGPILGVMSDIYGYTLGFTMVSLIIPPSIILLAKVKSEN